MGEKLLYRTRLINAHAEARASGFVASRAIATNDAAPSACNTSTSASASDDSALDAVTRHRSSLMSSIARRDANAPSSSADEGQGPYER